MDMQNCCSLSLFAWITAAFLAIATTPEKCFGQPLEFRRIGVAAGDTFPIEHTSEDQIVRALQFAVPFNGQVFIGVAMPHWGVIRETSAGSSVTRSRHTQLVPSTTYIELPPAVRGSWAASGLTASYQRFVPTTTSVSCGYVDTLHLTPSTYLQEADQAIGPSVGAINLNPVAASGVPSEWSYFSSVKASVNGSRVFWLGGIRPSDTSGASFHGLFQIDHYAAILPPSSTESNPPEIEALLASNRSLEVGSETWTIGQLQPIVRYNISSSGEHWTAIVRVLDSSNQPRECLVVDGQVVIVDGAAIATNTALPSVYQHAGVVTQLFECAISDSGSWLLSASVTGSARVHCVLSQNGLVLKENQQVAVPTLSDYATLRGRPRGLSCNASGDWALIWRSSASSRVRDLVVVNGFAVLAQFTSVQLADGATAELLTVDPAGFVSIGPRFTTSAQLTHIEIGVSGLLAASDMPSARSSAILITSPLSVPSFCDTIDFNRNNVHPEDQDVLDFFNVLAGGDCPYPAPCDTDFNNNGVFPEEQDVIDFFAVLAGGECGSS